MFGRSKRKSSKVQEDFEKRLRLRYGTRQANIYLFCCSLWTVLDSTYSSSLLSVVDRLVLHGSDEDLKAFQQSRTSICSTAGVSGAVFAQVAITALSLPSVQTAHWTCRGLFVIALTYGIFTVELSLVELVRLSSWQDPKQIRSRLGFRVVDEDTKEEYNGAAIDPVLRLAYPLRGLSFASWSLVPGLGVYLGTTWTSGGNDVPGENDTRNIFICFLCCIAFEVLGNFAIGLISAADDGVRPEIDGQPDDEEEAEQPHEENIQESTEKA